MVTVLFSAVPPHSNRIIHRKAVNLIASMSSNNQNREGKTDEETENGGTVLA
jgi:hypothetical protein